MEYYNPVHLYIGPRGVDTLGQLVQPYAAKGPVLLLTRGGDFLQSAVYHAVKRSLAGCALVEGDIAVSNPDVADMAAMIEQVCGKAYSLIIAIGGGTVMDTAKTLALALPAGIHGTAALRDFVIAGAYGSLTPIPWLGIPTTAGTGSEVTSWATVWDRECECKRSCSYSGNYAQGAIVDPAFTATCPLGLTVSSALDAICHSTESFWARHTNEISQAFALQSIRLIRAQLEPLTADLGNIEARLTIAKASTYAGLAFSNTKTTICHSVSYPLTEKFGIPHGTAAVLTLADFMAYNKEAIPRYRELLDAFGCADAVAVKKWIFQMLTRGGFGTNLAAYGVTKEDIPYIVSHAFTKGRADNNPVAVTADAVTNILKTVL